MTLLAQCQQQAVTTREKAVADVSTQSNSSQHADVSREHRLAFELGRQKAQHEIEQGQLAIETFGLPALDVSYWEEVLREQGIEVRWVAGCVVNDTILGHAEGYNKVSEAEIKRRFGSDFFDRMSKRAKDRYRLSLHPPRKLR